MVLNRESNIVKRTVSGNWVADDSHIKCLINNLMQNSKAKLCIFSIISLPSIPQIKREITRIDKAISAFFNFYENQGNQKLAVRTSLAKTMTFRATLLLKPRERMAPWSHSINVDFGNCGYISGMD